MEKKSFLALSTPQSVTQPAFGAEDGQDRWGKGQMQRDSIHITLKRFRDGDGPFPTEMKLLQCPPRLEQAPEPAAKPAPTPRAQPHSLSHRSSCPAPAMGSRALRPSRKRLRPPPLLTPPRAAHVSLGGVEVFAAGVGSAQPPANTPPEPLPSPACGVLVGTEPKSSQ